MFSRPWFLPAAVFLVCWTLTTHGKYSVTGDEPHYLIVSQSLWADGDLDLRNNHQRDEGALFGSAGLQPGPHAKETRDGQLFPVHDVGLPFVLAPVYTGAVNLARLPPEPVLKRFRMNRGLFAYSLISLSLIALTAWAATMSRSAIVAGGIASQTATGVVLLLWVSPPVLSNAFLVFPEVFALLATAWVVRLAAAPALERPEIYAAAVSLGFLPWFHRKYLPYVLALGAVLAWRHRTSIARLTPIARASAFALFVTPGIALAAWTWRYWGNLGGPLTGDRAPFSQAAFQAGALGLFVDRENGLFVWTPIYLLLGAAWALTWRRNRLWLLPAAALIGPAAAHDQWWGGFSPAARFLVPLAPIFASVTADAFQVRGYRRLFFVLAIPQIAISAYGWQHPRALWPRGDGSNRVLAVLFGAVGSTERVIPSIRTEMNLVGGVFAFSLILLANLAVWLVLRRRFTRSAAAAPNP